MRRSFLIRPCIVLFMTAGWLIVSRSVSAQSDPGVELVVSSGRALRVMLSDDITVHSVGQTVTGRLIEPAYAYDRIVLPVGTVVQGQITRLTGPSKLSRTRSMASGDFSPHRMIAMQFTSVVRDGKTTAIETIAKNETPHPKRAVAPDAEADGRDTGKVATAEREVKGQVSAAAASLRQQVSALFSEVKDPGRTDRVKQWAVNKLPYHPQTLHKGTVYDAELLTSLDFGKTTPHPLAPEGTLPAPDSILSARLLTTLDSGSTPRGSPLEAIVTEPVFAEDGRLIFPEGTKLTGEVTLVRQARRFHRNGQLRFLFERVEPPNQNSAPLLAAVHAIDVSADDHVALDDEGGAAVQNSKARFIEPALALLALRGSLEQGEGRGFDGGPAEARPTAISGGSGNNFARGVGSLIGFGAIGVVLGQVSRPLGIAFSAVGAARSVYRNVLGKGQEVRFQADTPIQVQLAPRGVDSR